MHHYYTKNFIMVVIVAILSGCAATPMTDQLTTSPPKELTEVTELTDVPFFAQTQFFCGPAALSIVLNTTGLDVTPEFIGKTIYTPGRQGTLQSEIITGTRRQGRLALPVRTLNDAFMNISKGRAVLVFQNLALEISPQWHYAVLVGFDLSKETVILRSGTTRRQLMSMKTFEHTWRRTGYWGVVVVSPEGDVPGNTTLSEWLQEAIGLDLAQKSPQSLTALNQAAQHWPASPAPLIAAANILITQDRLAEASLKLRTAVKRETDNPVALNNLAHVLMLQGNFEEAEAIAFKAVEVGGATKDTAYDTLRAIQEKMQAFKKPS